MLDEPGVDACGKSKIRAERAAWDFVDGEGKTLELVTILHVAVLDRCWATTCPAPTTSSSAA